MSRRAPNKFHLGQSRRRTEGRWSRRTRRRKLIDFNQKYHILYFRYLELGQRECGMFILGELRGRVGASLMSALCQFDSVFKRPLYNLGKLNLTIKGITEIKRSLRPGSSPLPERVYDSYTTVMRMTKSPSITGWGQQKVNWTFESSLQRASEVSTPFPF